MVSVISSTPPCCLVRGWRSIVAWRPSENPVVIEILSIELEDTLALATVVGSRSILGQLPTLKTIGDADSQAALFELLRHLSTQETPDEVFVEAAKQS